LAGKAQVRSRLSNQREAMQRLVEGVSQTDLARTYGVSQATISRLGSPTPFCG